MICERNASGAKGQALLREAEILGRCRHPGIVELRAAAVDGDMVRVITDLPPGAPLGDATLTAEEVAGVVAVLATTISDLHAIGVAHLRIDTSSVHLGFDGRPVLDRFDGAAVLDGPARRWPVHRLAGEDDRALGELFRALLSGSIGPSVPVASGTPPVRWPRALTRRSRREGTLGRGAMTSLVVWAARAARGEVTARELAEAMAVGVTGARLPVLSAAGRADRAMGPLSPGEADEITDPGRHGGLDWSTDRSRRAGLDGTSDTGRGGLDGRTDPHILDRLGATPDDAPAPLSDEAIEAWIAASGSAAESLRDDRGAWDLRMPASGPPSGDGGPRGSGAVARASEAGGRGPRAIGTAAERRPGDSGTRDPAAPGGPPWTDATSAAWAPFAPVAAPDIREPPEAPPDRWATPAPGNRLFERGNRLLDNPRRLAIAVAATAAVIMAIVLVGASSPPRHRAAGPAGPTTTTTAGATAPAPPRRPGATTEAPTSPPLIAVPEPAPGAPPSLAAQPPPSPSSARPALQFCMSVSADGSPVCTVGTYAQGVLRLGTNRFVVGRAGDVAAIGRWTCGPSTLALLRTGLVSEVWIFSAWPRAAGLSLAGHLVQTVPGGQTLAPVPEGACDALAVRRGDGTAVDLGPFDLGPSP